MLRKLFKKILNLTLRPLAKLYLKKTRTYSYAGIKIKVYPGVFHPGLFFSTRLLLSYLESFDILGKTLLELGAGSGLISIVCAQKGASVSATDISGAAIANLQENATANQVNINIIQSDLFDKIPFQVFDFIIINPPYFPRKPVSENEYAWYCGEDYEYFIKLFEGLENYIHNRSHVIMILSDDCDIDKIISLGKEKNFSFQLNMKKQVFWEMNYIYELNKIS